MFLLKKPLSIMAAMALILLLPSFEASALGGRNSEIGSSGSAGSGYFGLRGVGGKEVDFSSKYGKGTIVIQYKQRRLYYTLGNGRAIVYPIAVGKSYGRRIKGSTRINRKVVGPTWRPTPSMLAKNPKLPSVIHPGPGNPLGTHALYLGWQYIRIHGTSNPSSIGRAVSSGCIRMYNKDVAQLYKKVKVGTRVVAIE